MIAVPRFPKRRPAVLAAAVCLPLLAGPGGAVPGNAVPAGASSGRPQGAPPEADSILGQWRPREYRLRDGGTLPVDGRISFHRPDGAAEGEGPEGETTGEWFVLFFVTGGDGEPLRGSAEGGRFSREGESLLLTHTYHLSAGAAVGPLAETPLALALRTEAEAAENHREPCRVEISGRELTLFFPSGNSMAFHRVGAAPAGADLR